MLPVLPTACDTCERLCSSGRFVCSASVTVQRQTPPHRPPVDRLSSMLAGRPLNYGQPSTPPRRLDYT
eukprot:5692270-Pyramimonas_sp.AAC.1